MEAVIYKIQPVVLCGGNGSRLWPISTFETPKQFISLGNKGTLLGETINRISRLGVESKDYIIFDPLLIMHNTHKLPPENTDIHCNIIYEEYANDTAVAVARAALEIKSMHPKDSEIIMLVFPADHYIYNVDIFVKDILEGLTHLTYNNIILYGIDPTGPETKYGYIIPLNNGVKFKEKPDASLALELLNQNALWNSGIFAANTNLILERICNSPYNITDWITNPKEGKAPSFDVVVLQEYNNIYAHHCSGWRWSDVGTWESFTNIPEIQDEILKSSNVIMESCVNATVLNRNHSNLILIGCKDLLVVTNESDILIMQNTGDYNNLLKDIASRLGK